MSNRRSPRRSAAAQHPAATVASALLGVPITDRQLAQDALTAAVSETTVTAPLGPRAAAVVARYDATAARRCPHLRAGSCAPPAGPRACNAPAGPARTPPATTAGSTSPPRLTPGRPACTAWTCNSPPSPSTSASARPATGPTRTTRTPDPARS